jgi:hypothetical protein
LTVPAWPLFRGLIRVHSVVGLPLHAALADLALPEIGPAFLAHFACVVKLRSGWLIGHGVTPLLR